MLKYVHTVETFIVRVLIVFMLLAIALGTLELGRVLILEIFEPPFLLLDLNRLFESFGLILVILIGIELLKILKMFLSEDHLSPALVYRSRHHRALQ